MEPALKHRLIGAAVLSALAIIFLPMLIVAKDPNDTASRVPLKVPTAPAGDFETKELPLASPASGVPDGGVVGMNTSRPAVASPASPPASPVADGNAASDASPASPASGATSVSSPPATPQPAPAVAAAPIAASPAAAKPATTTPAPAPAPVAVAASKPPAAATSSPTVAASQPSAASPAAASAPAAPIPAANAGGHYVVSLGTYSNAGNAQSLVASLKAKQLPAYAETLMVAGKPATRVRIGPFQQRGDAEAARLKAQQVRSDMPASVTALDAATPAPEVSATTRTAASTPSAKLAATSPASAKPTASTAAAKPAASSAASGKTPPVNPPATVSAASPPGDQLAPPSPAAAGHGYAVQVSAFTVESQANALRDKLRAAGFVAYSEKVEAESGTRFRVRVGPEADRDAADHLRTQLSTKMNLSGMVVAYP